MLRRASDVERITARLALKSVRPRELAGLRETMKLLPDVVNAARSFAVARPDAGRSPDPTGLP